MRLKSRAEAVTLLATRRVAYKGHEPLVPGVPRGEVPMARVITCVHEAIWDPEAQKLHAVRSPPGHSAGESEGCMARVKGTIKRLVRDKGFGFIAAEGGAEYFFHSSACPSGAFDQLREGQSVSFDVGQGPKGPRAENVQTD